MIKLQVIGRIGHDATKEIVNGKPVINFSVADSYVYTGPDGVKTTRTTWVQCALWGTEGVAPYLKTGQSVFVEGIPSVSIYSSKKAGGTLEPSLNLKVLKLELVGSRKNEDQTGGSESEPVIVEGEKGEDLPF